MKKLIIFTSLLFSYSCSETKMESNREAMNAESPQILNVDNASENALSDGKAEVTKGKIIPEGVKVILGDITEQSKDSQLSLVRPQPALRFMDSTGLRRVFLPIFGSNPRNLSNGDFFTREEKRSLGFISLHNDNKNLLNMKEVQIASIDYIRSLRSFLADACNNLINQEVNDIHEDNILVKAVSPSKEQISSFIGKLIGYPKEGLHDGAEEIHEVMLNATKDIDVETAEGINQLKKSYLLMCVSLGSDIRVVSR